MTFINHSSKDGIIGLLVGDAVGVPYEFLDRETIARHPAVDMIGYGTHQQPAGTWSDDGALTVALLVSLIHHPELDTIDLGRRFIQWYRQGIWAARGEVFDIGIATRKAIAHIEQDPTRPEQAGGNDEYSNGNGSLMRILPLIYKLVNKDAATRLDWITRVSSLTHRHPVSILGGLIYVEIGIQLLQSPPSTTLKQCYQQACQHINVQYADYPEIERYQRLLSGEIDQFPIEEISSSGYVVHTLEASIWVLLHTSNYREAILQAVNLGEDTDTTAAVAGGLAGIYYGYEQIPKEWLHPLARLEEMVEYCEQFDQQGE
ncbi:ADP-ribosyl-[dinitrogen reductase] hydrolase [Paenibacillus sp. SORGH_AS306]|uniref:ADP-ribosylglycohydrolase family protein n=1 Tax=unclassified Paenibacillus TaxID=185978 RepID=UPI00278B6726|nr:MULTISPECIES: ADP-ribosylglycohydrolase family protein [unclassified Paenibacillus]MDQ1233894.1 ADP-ribosyl-[dinitrogen reductase] hydrolase [Paenibacillus sp. SORGH_AS_0306]MDR6110939.1 ADP-ribosyl-[dinitrogen reductase] hydrolase [Paenibacillus sp. SORGH_AS_0338]